jgi:hypothetical protein
MKFLKMPILSNKVTSKSCSWVEQVKERLLLLTTLGTSKMPWRAHMGFRAAKILPKKHWRTNQEGQWLRKQVVPQNMKSRLAKEISL